MSELKPIRFVELDSGVVREERVYGGKWIKLLYGTFLGRAISAFIAAPPISRLYGWLQDRPRSKRKVQPFIEQFEINMNDFLPEEGRTTDDPYSTFNALLPVTDQTRPFAQGPFPAPCDARYFAYAALNDEVSIPVKGSCFKASALLNHPEWNGVFDQAQGLLPVFVRWTTTAFTFPIRAVCWHLGASLGRFIQ